jgi:hypothetical protein
MSAVELKACCKNEWNPIEPGEAPYDKRLKGNIVVAGIDWGKGDTASGTSYSTLDIAMWDRDIFRTVFKKKYTGRMSEPLIQVEDMLSIIRSFNADLTIADTGDGRTSNAMMVKALGPQKFAEIYEHGTIRQKIKWDKEKGHYIMNRTRVMTDFIMEIKRAQVAFFNYEAFKEFQPDFTGIYSEYSERTRMTKYDHNVPDDAFHSWMFSRIACAILRGEYSRYLSGGMSEEGTHDEGKAFGAEDYDLGDFYG